MMDEEEQRSSSQSRPGSHGGAGRGQGRKPKVEEQRLRQRAIYLSENESEHCGRNWCFGIGASEYVRRLVQQDMRRVTLERSAHATAVLAPTEAISPSEENAERR